MALNTSKSLTEFAQSYGKKEFRGLETAADSSTVKDPYNLRKDGLNWYKSWPYAFKAKIGSKYEIFYLPISPQNINITTHFATNVIATLYSTVEEHSEVRYYDIAIQGTTGFVPTYVKSETFSRDASGKNSIVGNTTRTSYGSGEIVDSGVAGGFFRKTLNTVNSLANTAADILSSKKQEAGVFTDNNGYIAFHNFYRFLLKNKQTAAAGKASNEEVLTFLNYKDNNQYSCAVQRFVLERNAENPMLYNYSILIRAYNLKTIDSSIKADDLVDRYEAVGLKKDKKSLAAEIKSKVGLAKKGINQVRSLIGNVGR
jgi:hypothetical protein